MFTILPGFTIAGFIVGAVIPIAYGISILQAPSCGTSALGAWYLIIAGGPFGGTIGAVAGFACGAVCALYWRHMQPVRPNGRHYKPD